MGVTAWCLGLIGFGKCKPQGIDQCRVRQRRANLVCSDERNCLSLSHGSAA
jgi:hypothetical protein